MWRWFWLLLWLNYVMINSSIWISDDGSDSFYDAESGCNTNEAVTCITNEGLCIGLPKYYAFCGSHGVGCFRYLKISSVVCCLGAMFDSRLIAIFEFIFMKGLLRCLNSFFFEWIGVEFYGMYSIMFFFCQIA